MPFELSYLQKYFFCLLVISYYPDSFVFFYMQSTVNVPYHRVKAVQIVKQTSKEIVYTI